MYWNTSSDEDDERRLVGYSDISRLDGSFALSSQSHAVLSANDTVDSANVTWPVLVPTTIARPDDCFDEFVDRTWSDRASYVFGALCLAISSVGLILNVTVIFSIVHIRQLRSQVANVLLCNLAVASLMACAVMLIVEVPVRLLARTSISGRHQSVCETIGFLTSVLTTATIWTVVALSVDKCRSIDSPLRHSHLVNKFKMAAYFACIWSTAVVLSSFPMMSGRSYVFQPAEGTCGLSYEADSRRWYSLVYLILTHYIPGFIVCFCHWRIFAIARVQSRRMATMVHLVTLIQVPLLNGRVAAQQLSPQGRKAIYTTSIFVGTFVVCYLPHALLSTARLFSSVVNHQVVVSITVLLERSAFALNIFIYGCRNRMVRDSFSKYLRRKLLERSSSLQWSRDRHRRQSSIRSTARANGTPSPNPRREARYQRISLSATQSHPILNRTPFSPELPRSISLDVDLDEVTSGKSRQNSASCRRLDRVTSWCRPTASSSWGERRRPELDLAAPTRNHSGSADEAGRADCVQEDGGPVCVRHRDQTNTDNDKILVTSNGLLPLSSHHALFVALKESVV